MKRGDIGGEQGVVAEGRVATGAAAAAEGMNASDDELMVGSEEGEEEEPDWEELVEIVETGGSRVT